MFWGGGRKIEEDLPIDTLHWILMSGAARRLHTSTPRPLSSNSFASHNPRILSNEMERLTREREWPSTFFSTSFSLNVQVWIVFTGSVLAVVVVVVVKTWSSDKLYPLGDIIHFLFSFYDLLPHVENIKIFHFLLLLKIYRNNVDTCINYIWDHTRWWFSFPRFREN